VLRPYYHSYDREPRRSRSFLPPNDPRGRTHPMLGGRPPGVFQLPLDATAKANARSSRPTRSGADTEGSVVVNYGNLSPH
jgi:hypothetical protein